MSARASATSSLITCGHTGHLKVTWIELPCSRWLLLVHLPSVVPQNRKGGAPFLRFTQLDECTQTCWLRDPNVIVHIHSLSFFPRGTSQVWKEAALKPLCLSVCHVLIDLNFNSLFWNIKNTHTKQTMVLYPIRPCAYHSALTLTNLFPLILFHLS